ncbi:hypothetical protein [Anaerotruncus rubiinfantis]|jgi:hypothetical protein|uniref:hypothetical protein n=1 Tax=Anaerotruncus rubiinfantis TaxID=1720200 RepID=UPI0018999343|nr:hypothetical protein [Anaerotruncus rubiinfantis]
MVRLRQHPFFRGLLMLAAISCIFTGAFSLAVAAAASYHPGGLSAGQILQPGDTVEIGAGGSISYYYRDDIIGDPIADRTLYTLAQVEQLGSCDRVEDETDFDGWEVMSVNGLGGRNYEVSVREHFSVSGPGPEPVPDTAEAKLRAYLAPTSDASSLFVDKTSKLLSAASGNDAVRSDNKVYYYPFSATLNDAFFSVRIAKEKGGKQVLSAKWLEKKLDNAYSVFSGAQESALSGTRKSFAEISLRETNDDSETKIQIKVTVKAKKEIRENGAVIVPKGAEATFLSPAFYFTNETLRGDRDFSAGDGGMVAKPVKNEDNEVTWTDENNTLAVLYFTADSNVKIYYPKLSTRWNHSDYAGRFAGQDAFIRSFVGNPEISAVSRATLDLNVPYLNEDGDPSIETEAIAVYEEIDGILTDITGKGKFCENENDELVFRLKVRQLGTYIFASAPAAKTAVENT